jgi:hypothetical protein
MYVYGVLVLLPSLTLTRYPYWLFVNSHAAAAYGHNDMLTYLITTKVAF